MLDRRRPSQIEVLAYFKLVFEKCFYFACVTSIFQYRALGEYNEIFNATYFYT